MADSTFMGPDMTEARLAAHLHEENMRHLLQVAGLYVLAYDLVKSVTINGVKGFFLTGFDADGYTYSDEWAQVRAARKHELDACLAWLMDSDVLSEGLVKAVADLRDERNRVGHQLHVALVDPDAAPDTQLLNKSRDILKRLAVFFGSIEVDCDPYFVGEVDVDGIESIPSMLLLEAMKACGLGPVGPANWTA